MSLDPNDLLHGYFDDTLTDEQMLQLNEWIQSDDAHAMQFIELAMLHDRMREAIIGIDAPVDDANELGVLTLKSRPVADTWSARRLAPVWLASACAMALIGMLIWNGFGPATAAAASRELDRLIELNQRSSDRTYEILVERFVDETPTPRAPAEERSRPPKPPLTGARLYVRDDRQFVLVRYEADGAPFVTGSNGDLSWAVRPIGPVRTSSDLSRFSRDLPGHETSIPLTNIYAGLSHLKNAYQLQFATLGPEEVDSNDHEECRMLIAVKKPRVRGPQRVEIIYAVDTGSIRSFRFVQMPYGPQRLDLRLNLIDESPLASGFFDHTSHHTPDRAVVPEE